ncbi:MAG: tyrosine-type recombinase/integrase [Clostridiales bacterium]|jgi:site-specific recombinase XerD|nr:tyrosine-type recombinase/integrase [Clostridiales bacterium]
MKISIELHCVLSRKGRSALKIEELRNDMQHFKTYLVLSELSERTVNKYMHDINSLLAFLELDRKLPELSKEGLIEYKKQVLEGYNVTSANTYFVAINRYLGWLGLAELKLKSERVQNNWSIDKVISKGEYEQLCKYALENHLKKYYYIMRVLACTGIRIGELKYITKESIQNGMATVCHKSKHRDIFISDELIFLLSGYCTELEIKQGFIFFGRNMERPLCESCVWKMLKQIAKHAGIDSNKVYPHSFRHLFAKTYMTEVGNIAELADILGHSSIETTRLYTLTSKTEKRRNIAKLGL